MPKATGAFFPPLLPFLVLVEVYIVLVRELIAKTPAKLLFSLGVSVFVHILLLQFSLSPGSSPAVALAGGGLSVVLRSAALPVADREFPEGQIELSGTGLPDHMGASGPFPANSGTLLGAADTPAVLPNPPSSEILMLPLPLQQTTYFRRADLTTSPELLEEPVIDLADVSGAPAKNIGKLKLRLYINTYGEVDKGEIESASSSPVSDAAAMAVFRGLRFRPGEIKGAAVNSQLVFEVDFDSLAIGASRSTGHSQILHDTSGR